jgi:hypothetical protein
MNTGSKFSVQINISALAQCQKDLKAGDLMTCSVWAIGLDPALGKATACISLLQLYMLTDCIFKETHDLLSEKLLGCRCDGLHCV